MLKSYFTIAIRNLWRNKNYTLINIFGLSVAIAACILIGLYVHNEISFDKTLTHKNQLYRINEYLHYDGAAPQSSAATGAPIASFLQSNHSEIEKQTRVFPATPDIYSSIFLEYNGKKIQTSQMACADSTFADMFDLKIIEGNKTGFLRDLNAVVLTKSLANKLFGNSTALHKMIAMHTNDSILYVAVSHVIEDLPKTSHIQLEGILPVPEHFGYQLENNYGAMIGPAYVQLRPGVNVKTLGQALNKTLHTKNPGIDIMLQPLSSVHTKSTEINYDYFNYRKIDGKYIKIFVAIALAIFIIACLNFINLTVAIAGYRGKEIAIKKIAGAQRIHIVMQIITETLVAVAIALVVALFSAGFSLPFMNSILDRDLETSVLFKPVLLSIYFIILIVTTLLAGAYPAWLISNSKVNEVLKTKILTGRTKAAFQNILVTGQFTIAMVFMVSLVVFIKQLNYLQNKDLGYAINQVIKIPLNMEDAAKLPILRTELLKVKGVKDITNGYMELGGEGSLFGIDYIAPDGQAKHVSVNFENTGPHYLDFFGMKIVAGRNFTKGAPTNEYIINETLAKQIGFSNPLDKQINLSGGYPPGKVVGVVKDYNYQSLHANIEPLILSSIDFIPYWQNKIYIKLSSLQIANTLSDIESKVMQLTGEPELSYEFLDEHFKAIYHTEKEAGTMIAIIGGLALLIACLGLLGLSAFIIVKRTKEIGIRKVLGASLGSITLLLSRDFLKLVLIAILIASPIAWYVMSEWLQGFAYRVQLSWWMFALAGILSIILAMVTVSVQAIRAGISNPVKSLRTE